MNLKEIGTCRPNLKLVEKVRNICRNVYEDFMKTNYGGVLEQYQENLNLKFAMKIIFSHLYLSILDKYRKNLLKNTTFL